VNYGGRRAEAIGSEVGRRIRRRRLELGLTQQQIAELVVVNCQQLHKYETDISRLAAGPLHQIAEAPAVYDGTMLLDNACQAAKRMRDRIKRTKNEAYRREERLAGLCKRVPGSLAELSGRAMPKPSRTLRTIGRYSQFKLQRGERRAPRKLRW
jgi:transcriptional regulator with XRE-family HTH domain